jgi:hypothetical integral membrane protein (TIGR02206 family)
MDLFFAKDFPGEPFVLFSTQHLTAIAVFALVVLTLILARKKINERAGVRIRYTLAALLILNEISWHWWNYATGQWTVQTMLPLHLCSVFVFLSAIMLVTRNYRIYEFAYFLGIAGAIQPIFTPDLGIYSFPHLRYFQVFISHGSIVIAAIYMTFVEGYRPTWGSFARAFMWTNIYMAIVGLINGLIGSNYLFIAHKPETASLIDLLGPWPWYILSLEAIGLVFFLILYLPFALRDLTTRPVVATRSTV